MHVLSYGSYTGDSWEGGHARVLTVPVFVLLHPLQYRRLHVVGRSDAIIISFDMNSIGNKGINWMGMYDAHRANDGLVNCDGRGEHGHNHRIRLANIMVCR